ncbi:MAG: deoxyribose-phosphate aldolase [Thermoprotei archaeon]|nr:MAG: deoxyribose-phosphate aldolase [Thermoprotei archaeon]RLF19652.1 MAG: deoxyribose-phosphate aldolase [Thermoprotei archaeon]
MLLRRREFLKMIEHTILKPNATLKDVERYCKEAMEYGFGAVYVSPCYVEHASSIIKDKDIIVGTVVGFPLGFETIDVKAYQTRVALERGARAIDMVMNIGMFKDGKYDYVLREIKSVVNTVKEFSEDVPVKVIIETGYLTDEEISKATEIVARAGADYVKTCTGFGPRGVTVHDIIIIRDTLKRINLLDRVKIKAAGGIRNLSQALSLIKAGASKIGTSTGVAIAKEFRTEKMEI